MVGEEGEEVEDGRRGKIGVGEDEREGEGDRGMDREVVVETIVVMVTSRVVAVVTDSREGEEVVTVEEEV